MSVGPFRWLAVPAAAAPYALATGIPTGIVATSFYTRMTPVTWWDDFYWSLSTLLIALIAFVYLWRRRLPSSTDGYRTTGAGVLATLAIGCPICNKIVVALIGVSGALTYWAPLQPVIGAVAVGLLAATLGLQFRGRAACPAG